MSENGILSSKINKVYDNQFPTALDYIRENKIHLILNTPLSRVTRDDSFAIRQAAIRYKIPCLTTASAAKALIKGMIEMIDKGFTIRSLQEIHSSK